MISLEIFEESFPLAQIFKISRGSKTEAKIIRVQIEEDGIIGQGECVPYARYGETPDSVCKQIEALDEIPSREELQSLMPAGAARNALDCALWDIEAKQTGKPVWQLAGLPEPQPCTTAYTLSLDTPQIMQEQARQNADRPLLKIKLGTPEDIPRLEAVRKGAPKAKIIVDANEGWDIETLNSIESDLLQYNIALIEQPLPENSDEVLKANQFSLPLCADESSHTSEGLDKLIERYKFVNIKLDKTGGLTEALKMKRLATDMGFGIFIGCMVGTSLGMAPAMLLAQGADYVDLDGPLLLSQDRPHGLVYNGSIVHPPTQELWG